MRAAFKGYADAVADPAAAVKISVEAINAAGNQNFLTEAGETYRWQQESAIVKKGTPSGPVGLIDPAIFMNEVAAYDKAGCLQERHAIDRRHVRHVGGHRPVRLERPGDLAQQLT